MDDEKSNCCSVEDCGVEVDKDGVFVVLGGGFDVEYFLVEIGFVIFD